MYKHVSTRATPIFCYSQINTLMYDLFQNNGISVVVKFQLVINIYTQMMMESLEIWVPLMS